jgi:hypothetical protein
MQTGMAIGHPLEMVVYGSSIDGQNLLLTFNLVEFSWKLQGNHQKIQIEKLWNL